ncbi:MAG: hypothetical protein H6955_06365 [Chromatiaceae bacterium]|nr:hypothetical protein [Chromatiaceae bacterium]
MQIIKKGKCPTLSNKSTLTYEIGRDEADHIHMRISSNTGGGFYSGEWVAVKDIEVALQKEPEAITSLALFRLFKGKSVNTPAFLLAALKAEGVVQAVKGRQRKHTLVDIGRITEAGNTPARKKSSVKKKATAARSRKQ